MKFHQIEVSRDYSLIIMQVFTILTHFSGFILGVTYAHYRKLKPHEENKTKDLEPSHKHTPTTCCEQV